MRVTYDAVTVEVAGWRPVDDVTIEVRDGSFTALAGPNGAGKSSLLRCLYRAMRPATGVVCVQQDDVWRLSGSAAGKRVAAVVQEPAAGFDMTVRELVSLGRIPHHRGWERLDAADHQIVVDALARVGLAGFAHRQLATLSGGERQRAMIARAVAQQANVLVLDEPTNHLDIRHQLEVLELVRSLGVTTVAALHDISLADRYADQVILLDAGRVVAHGPPASTITAESVRRVFGLDVRFLVDPGTQRRTMTFDLPAPL